MFTEVSIKFQSNLAINLMVLALLSTLMVRFTRDTGKMASGQDTDVLSTQMGQVTLVSGVMICVMD